MSHVAAISRSPWRKPDLRDMFAPCFPRKRSRSPPLVSFMTRPEGLLRRHSASPAPLRRDAPLKRELPAVPSLVGAKCKQEIVASGVAQCDKGGATELVSPKKEGNHSLTLCQRDERPFPPDPQDSRLTVEGAVCYRDGRLLFDAYTDLRRFFAYESKVDSHPDPNRPGARPGEEADLHDLVVWNNSYARTANHHGDPTCGSGWITYHPTEHTLVGERMSKPFNIQTWGSWRLTFLLARLQRDVWSRRGACALTTPARSHGAPRHKTTPPGSGEVVSRTVDGAGVESVRSFSCWQGSRPKKEMKDMHKEHEIKDNEKNEKVDKGEEQNDHWKHAAIDEDCASKKPGMRQDEHFLRKQLTPSAAMLQKKRVREEQNVESKSSELQNASTHTCYGHNNHHVPRVVDQNSQDNMVCEGKLLHKRKWRRSEAVAMPAGMAEVVRTCSHAPEEQGPDTSFPPGTTRHGCSSGDAASTALGTPKKGIGAAEAGIAGGHGI